LKKKALVTGASSGIGLAIARQLIHEGCEVDGIARSFKTTDCDGLRTHQLDLSDIDSLPDRLAELDEDLSSEPDMLVLNAGIGRFGGLEQFSHRQINEVINTNLVSYLYVLKHFLPRMKGRGSGDIVLLGSESALQGARAGAVYCASKFAIRGLAQSLRADCSTSDIRVMLVNPGPVNSDFFDDLNFEPVDGEEFVLEPEDVARAVSDALAQPRNVVLEELNLQPMKRSFRKKQ